ncbi:unnamed protein product, partial [Phaeothamnion confervicola]
QLGYLPKNLVEIAARSVDGKRAPTVLKLYPLAEPTRRTRNGGGLKPFPTMYWLCCPYLKLHVSRLEAQGLVPLWEERLQ